MTVQTNLYFDDLVGNTQKNKQQFIHLIIVLATAIRLFIYIDTG